MATDKKKSNISKPAPKKTEETKKVEDPRRMDDAVEENLTTEDHKADPGPASEADLYSAARAVQREGHLPQHYDLDAIAKDIQRGIKPRNAVAAHRTI